MTDFAIRRKFERLPCDIPVTLLPHPGPRFLRGIGRNIGEGGLYVLLDVTKVKIGDTLKVRLGTPDSHFPEILFVSTVRWLSAAEGGVGLEFALDVEASKDELLTVIQYVKALT